MLKQLTFVRIECWFCLYREHVYSWLLDLAEKLVKARTSSNLTEGNTNSCQLFHVLDLLYKGYCERKLEMVREHEWVFPPLIKLLQTFLSDECFYDSFFFTTKFAPILIGLNWSHHAIVFIHRETLYPDG